MNKPTCNYPSGDEGWHWPDPDLYPEGGRNYPEPMPDGWGI